MGAAHPQLERWVHWAKITFKGSAIFIKSNAEQRLHIKPAEVLFEYFNTSQRCVAPLLKHTKPHLLQKGVGVFVKKCLFKQ